MIRAVFQWLGRFVFALTAVVALFVGVSAWRYGGHRYDMEKMGLTHQHELGTLGLKLKAQNILEINRFAFGERALEMIQDMVEAIVDGRGENLKRLMRD